MRLFSLASSWIDAIMIFSAAAGKANASEKSRMICRTDVERLDGKYGLPRTKSLPNGTNPYRPFTWRGMANLSERIKVLAPNIVP
jgi:hypothetical protein